MQDIIQSILQNQNKINVNNLAIEGVRDTSGARLVRRTGEWDPRPLSPRGRDSPFQNSPRG